jgi:hypothetical protein
MRPGVVKVTADRQSLAAGRLAGDTAFTELPTHDAIDLLRPLMHLAWTWT